MIRERLRSRHHAEGCRVVYVEARRIGIERIGEIDIVEKIECVGREFHLHAFCDVGHFSNAHIEIPEAESIDWMGLTGAPVDAQERRAERIVDLLRIGKYVDSGSAIGGIPVGADAAGAVHVMVHAAADRRGANIGDGPGIGGKISVGAPAAA